jgi:hypothetical protein
MKRITIAATTNKIDIILFIENTNSCPINKSKIGGFTKKIATMNKTDALIAFVVFFISPALLGISLSILQQYSYVNLKTVNAGIVLSIQDLLIPC